LSARRDRWADAESNEHADVIKADGKNRLGTTVCSPSDESNKLP
jgi:hypothetical protein